MKRVIPEDALNQHVAVLGKTGAGKSYASKGIVEGLIRDGRQVCVLDPTAAWWGLRLGSDGKRKGFDVVLLGGRHGDIPLAERSGDAVARLVTEQRASVVLDTSGMTVGEYTRWFIDFASALYTTIRAPLHLVIDESHQFMPQGGGGRMDVDAGKMLHAGNRLMSGGRSLGIRGMLITQRPAKLHKDALTCADSLIAMRVIAPQDRKAVQDWVDGCGDPVQGKEVVNSLASLKRGQGWVWYPEGGWLKQVTFPKIKTYDSSATPKHGAGSAPKVAEIDLDSVKAAMSEAVAEAERNDPAKLRARIAELERQLADGGTTRDEAQVAAERERAWAAGWHARDEEVDQLRAALDRYQETVARIYEISETQIYVPPHVDIPDPPEATQPPAPARSQRRTARRAPVKRDHQSLASGDDLPKGEAAVLTACIQFPAGVMREQLTVLTGYKRSSRDQYIQRLMQKGLVQRDGKRILATPDGFDALPGVEPLPTGKALQAYWLDRLPAGEAAILQVLLEGGGNDVPRDLISDRTGYKRSSRDQYLQRLKAKELVTIGPGVVAASPTLFGEGVV